MIDHIKNFGYIFLLLILLICSACNKSDGERQFIPNEFEFPFEKIGKGKTFIYKQEGQANKTFFKDVNSIIEGNRKFIIYQNYTPTEKGDSAKFTKNHNLVETFIFLSPDDSRNLDFPNKVKGRIMEDSIIRTERKIGIRLSKIVFEGEKDFFSINSREEYLKDTVLRWQGKPLDGIVTQKRTIIGFTGKENSNDIQNEEFNGNYYYAKGIGLMFFTRITEKFNSKFSLVEIKDTKGKE